MNSKIETSSLAIENRLLLLPGPSELHPRVKQAMMSQLMGQGEPEFLDILAKVQVMLRNLFQTDNEMTFAITGGGTAAMEAALLSVIYPGTRVLSCINGHFGKRLSEMAFRFGAEVTELHTPWGRHFEPIDLSEAMAKTKPEVVTIVHAETSTGVLQPLDEIVNIIHEHNALVIVDTVTSLAGSEVAVDKTGIDICYSAGQKCINCPPGIGLITITPQVAKLIKSRTETMKSFFFDLNLINDYWMAPHKYHHTPPIPSIYALYESLRVIFEEGLDARWKRHQENAKYLEERIKRLNLEFFVENPSYRSPMLTTVKIPQDVDGKMIQSQLMERFRIGIAGGLGEIAGKIWRIGLMGWGSTKSNIDLLSAALGELL